MADVSFNCEHKIEDAAGCNEVRIAGLTCDSPVVPSSAGAALTESPKGSASAEGTVLSPQTCAHLWPGLEYLPALLRNVWPLEPADGN